MDKGVRNSELPFLVLQEIPREFLLRKNAPQGCARFCIGSGWHD